MNSTRVEKAAVCTQTLCADWKMWLEAQLNSSDSFDSRYYWNSWFGSKGFRPPRWPHTSKKPRRLRSEIGDFNWCVITMATAGGAETQAAVAHQTLACSRWTNICLSWVDSSHVCDVKMRQLTKRHHHSSLTLETGLTARPPSAAGTDAIYEGSVCWVIMDKICTGAGTSSAPGTSACVTKFIYVNFIRCAGAGWRWWCYIEIQRFKL